MRRLFSCVVCMLCVWLTACAHKQTEEASPLVDMPPQSSVATLPEKPANPVPQTGQTLTSHDASSSRSGDPEALNVLLEMKNNAPPETAVSLMRPSAIKEAAQTVTFQTAMAYRYKQLLTATEKHHAALDAAFNFGPLLMTQGDALILPPVLTRAGASLRIESGEAATAAETSYELLAPASYVARPPSWQEFLMVDAFPEPEKPNPAVMPKNDKERNIWQVAVREAWAQGITEADHLYADNVSRLARQYRGVMLYHLLTAQHLMSKVHTASSSLGMKTTDNGNKLHIGQKVYRITSPSAFTPRSIESMRTQTVRRK